MAKLHEQVTAEDHSKGDASARVTLVEYGDYQCPDCWVAYRELKKVFRHYGDELRFVFRNFPLEMHPMAEPAAEAAEYAAAEGKFWEMHDGIYEHQRELSVEMLAALAKKVGLDAAAAEGAIDEQTYEERIERDRSSGEKSGVHGTPTFYINGVEFEDDYSSENLIIAIDAAS